LFTDKNYWENQQKLNAEKIEKIKNDPNIQKVTRVFVTFNREKEQEVC
jgi:hypothetical protein